MIKAIPDTVNMKDDKLNSTSNSLMRTLIKQKRMTLRQTPDVSIISIKPPIPELDKSKIARTALRRAKEQLTHKNRKILEEFKKEAKKMEREIEIGRKTLEKEIENRTVYETAMLKQSQEQRKELLRQGPISCIKEYRDMIETMENEFKDLEVRLTNEASAKRADLRPKIISDRLQRFEQALKGQLGQGIAICEELHAIQLVEINRLSSKELCAIELRHATELGDCLREQATSTTTDGNPTITPELAEKQKATLDYQSSVHNGRIKKLEDHHNHIVDNLFTTYHAGLASLKNMAMEVVPSAPLPVGVVTPLPTSPVPDSPMTTPLPPPPTLYQNESIIPSPAVRLSEALERPINRNLVRNHSFTQTSSLPDPLESQPFTNEKADSNRELENRSKSGPMTSRQSNQFKTWTVNTLAAYRAADL
eukprot:Ihof_evm9s25 gene=Ihof_evmTU9s25